MFKFENGKNRQRTAKRILRLTSFTTVIAGIFATLALESILYVAVNSEYNRHANIWVKSLPSAIFPHLVSSSAMPIRDQIFLVQNTRLFSYVAVKNRNDSVLASFGEPSQRNKSQIIPVKDEVGMVWGSIHLRENQFIWESHFWAFGCCILLCFLLLALVIRSLTSKIVQCERLNFNKALEAFSEVKSMVASKSNLDVLPKYGKGMVSGSDEEAQVHELAHSLIIEIQKIIETHNHEVGKTDAIAKSTKMLAHDIRRTLNLVKGLSQILKSVSSVEEFQNIMVKFQPDMDRATASVQRLVKVVFEASRHNNRS